MKEQYKATHESLLAITLEKPNHPREEHQFIVDWQMEPLRKTLEHDPYPDASIPPAKKETR